QQPCLASGLLIRFRAPRDQLRRGARIFPALFASFQAWDRSPCRYWVWGTKRKSCARLEPAGFFDPERSWEGEICCGAQCALHAQIDSCSRKLSASTISLATSTWAVTPSCSIATTPPSSLHF